MSKNMDLTRVTKKIRVSEYDCVKYQVITELVFLRKEHLIPTDIEFLSYLGVWGPTELRKFCADAARQSYPEMKPEEIATREQNVRNRLVKLEKRGIILKEKRKNKNVIKLNPDLNIVLNGNTLLDYNVLTVVSKKPSL